MSAISLLLLMTAAEPTELERLAADVARARADVDTLSSEVDAARAEAKEEQLAAARRRAALEGDLETARMKRVELERRVAALEDRLRRDGAAKAASAAPVRAAVARLHAGVAKGVPFRLRERIAILDDIERTLASDDTARAIEMVTAFLDSELELARTIARVRMPVNIDDKPVMAEVARIGRVALIFRTRDGVAGAAAHGAWQVFDDPADTARAAGLLDSLARPRPSGVVLVFSIFVAASEPGGALAAAYKRELLLLEAERAALFAAHGEVLRLRAERSAAARKQIAALEAQLIEEGAKNDALAARLGELERRAVQVEQSSTAAISAAKAQLGRRGVEGADLDALLANAVDRLEREARVRSAEGMFFDEGGRLVNGAVVQIGGVSALGVGKAAAGVLAEVPGGRGLFEIIPGTDEKARAFVSGTGALPLLLTAPDASAATPSLTERISGGGPISFIALVVGALALIGTFVKCAWLLRQARSMRGVVESAAAELADGDGFAAAAICRSAGGPAGRVWGSVAAAAFRADDVGDDVAADRILEESATLERGDRLLVAAIFASLVLGGSVALRGAVASLEHALVLAAAAGLALAAARALSERAKREIERGAFRLIDVAHRARRG
jgi:hypothetical protein